MRCKNSFIHAFFKSTNGETLFLFGKNFSKSSTSSSRVVRDEIFVNSNKMNNLNNNNGRKCFTTTTTTKNASSESFLSSPGGSFSLGAMKRLLLFSSGRDSSFSWNALKKRGGTLTHEKKIQRKRRKLSVVVGKSLEKSRGERGKSGPAFKSVEEW